MIEKHHLSQLIDISKILLKFSEDGIRLYKIEDSIYSGIINQKKNSNKVTYNKFVLETKIDIDADEIIISKEALEYLKNTKKSKIDFNVLNNIITLNNNIEYSKEEVSFNLKDKNVIIYELTPDNEGVIDVKDGDSFLYVDSILLPNVISKNSIVEITFNENKAYIGVIHIETPKESEDKSTKKKKTKKPDYYIKTIGEATIII